MSGWIGVDFDGTLATYTAWVSAEHTGDAIQPMVDRVKKWLAEGREVRIFTARVYPLLIVHPHEDPAQSHRVPHPFEGRDSEGAVHTIREWCVRHFGKPLTITCVKDHGMIELWDDRAVQVGMNTGIPVGNSTRGL